MDIVSRTPFTLKLIQRFPGMNVIYGKMDFILWQQKKMRH